MEKQVKAVSINAINLENQLKFSLEWTLGVLTVLFFNPVQFLPYRNSLEILRGRAETKHIGLHA